MQGNLKIVLDNKAVVDNNHDEIYSPIDHTHDLSNYLSKSDTYTFLSWKKKTIPDSNNWKSICYGNGKFVAVWDSDDIVIYSTDGITWTETTLPTINSSWMSVFYGNGIFVAVGFSIMFAYGGTEGEWFAVNQGIIAALSPDGISWTEQIFYLMM